MEIMLHILNGEEHLDIQTEIYTETNGKNFNNRLFYKINGHQFCASRTKYSG